MVSHKDHFEEPNLHIKSRRLKRIIDGEFATLSEFPSSALLYQSSNVMEFRGAVIVGSRHVITHERCVYGVNANDCRITVGVLSPLSESSMTTKGEEQIERKTYIGMNISRNSHSQIAVIKTVKDIKFGDHVKPAKVPWTDLCLISPGQSYKIQAGAASETFDENVECGHVQKNAIHLQAVF
ncbi:hypothetical protein L596_021270 [Steinernema carpocapsae]|uniref:Peptidase S1 domain-containing protein n=1 Tax=Steinernema carpocapsae TaxID=34508 RepID=A0A4U5MI47_STECR|nr:hypothetical protein L596_021270 [Steinernema carpocapsae]